MSGISISDRLCIEGGGLKRFTQWVPREVTALEGQKFVALHSNEYLLHEFVGKSLRAGECCLLNDLRMTRNDAVNQMILKKMREEDSTCQMTELPRGAKRFIDPSTLPATVSFSCPALIWGGKEIPAFDIVMATELNPLKCVSVACDVETLTWLREAAHAWGGHRKRKVRADADRVDTGYQFITADYRRKSLKVKYCDRDGTNRQHWRKPDTWDPESMDAACDSLINFLTNNHYAQNSAGEWVLASSINADMFAQEHGVESLDSSENSDQSGEVAASASDKSAETSAAAAPASPASLARPFSLSPISEQPSSRGSPASIAEDQAFAGSFS